MSRAVNGRLRQKCTPVLFGKPTHLVEFEPRGQGLMGAWSGGFDLGKAQYSLEDLVGRVPLSGSR